LGSLDLLFSDLLLAEMLSSQHEIAQPTGCWTIKSNSGVGLTLLRPSDWPCCPPAARSGRPAIF
jgi:hypothetical protein